jgi:hypothetical protein
MAQADAAVTLIAPIFASNPVHESVHESPHASAGAGCGVSSSAARILVLATKPPGTPGYHETTRLIFAIELQFSEITDAEWIARHEDYAWARIADLWLWHPGIQVPRAVFRYDQHGWLLNLDTGQVGLIYAQPDLGAVKAMLQAPGCCAVHWPPCPGDRLATLWMPLKSARLTRTGSSCVNGQVASRNYR